jgi:hypothetical protein
LEVHIILQAKLYFLFTVYKYTMKRILILLLAALATPYFSGAQQVPRQIIVEHFTNTYCSVCANRNPGFYANLGNFQQVLHIAYHPSAPYPACPLNQHNKPENDDRTNFYGVYGATPRLVIQGEALPANANYNDASIFSSRLGETSSFKMTTRLQEGNASLAVTVTIVKTDTSSLTSLDLYTVLVEDTLYFTGNNGEPLQHDVFRQSFFGSQPAAITVPTAVGDSVVHTQTINIRPVWNLAQCYAIAVAHTPDKKIEQASRSPKLNSASTGMSQLQGKDAFCPYPVPAREEIWLMGSFTEPLKAEVWDIQGRMLLQQTVEDQHDFIDLSGIQAGTYFLKIRNSKGFQVMPFSRL